MPTPTYTALSTITLGSAAASVTFGSIPATYRDLVLVAAHERSVTTGMRVRLNGDTGSNYNFVRAMGDGSTATSGAASNFTFAAITQIDFSGNTQLLTSFNFMDYSATDKHKTFLVRSNSASNGTGMDAHRWASTSAINTILIYLTSGNYNAGSTFSLYGVIA